jgi:hypothetical protein
MAVPTSVADLSTTAASNSPVAADNVFPDLDDFLRFHSAALASIYANTATNGWVSPYMPKAGGTFTGAVTGITNLTTTGSTILGNAQGDTLNVAAGAIAVGPAGNVTVALPSSGASLIVNQSGSTEGLTIQASGGGSAALRLNDAQAGTRSWYVINGSTAPGVFSIYDGTADVHRVQVNTSGNVTIANPTSGVGLTVSGGGIAVTGASAITGAVTGITDLTTTGNTILGNAVGDTFNVADGAISVNATGNVTMRAASGGMTTLVVAPVSGANAAWFQGVFGSSVISFASLPAAVFVGRGARAMIDDATATTFASVAAGGGANTVPVYSDGVDWRIG